MTRPRYQLLKEQELPISHLSVLNNYAYYLQINVQDEEQVNLQNLTHLRLLLKHYIKITANKEIINR